MVIARVSAVSCWIAVVVVVAAAKERAAWQSALERAVRNSWAKTGLEIPKRPSVYNAAGFHFPIPSSDGTFEVAVRDLSSIAGGAVLGLFWGILEEEFAASGVANPGRLMVVAHAHGQKEPVEELEADNLRSYGLLADSLFDWTKARWVSVAVGATSRPTSTEPTTLVARRDADTGRLLLTENLSMYYCGGRKTWCNFQSNEAPPVTLTQAGEAVIRSVTESLPCEGAALVRSTMYSESIHLVRAAGNPTHHFDFHRFASRSQFLARRGE